MGNLNRVLIALSWLIFFSATRMIVQGGDIVLVSVYDSLYWQALRNSLENMLNIKNRHSAPC